MRNWFCCLSAAVSAIFSGIVPESWGYTNMVGNYIFRYTISDGGAHIAPSYSVATGERFAAITPRPSGDFALPEFLPDSQTNYWPLVEILGFHGKVTIGKACSGSMTNVSIPDTVTNVGYGAFADCTNLASLTLPLALKSVGWGAFANCPLVERVEFPAGLLSIGYYTFSGCTGLTEAVFPDGLQTIGQGAFSSLSFSESRDVRGPYEACTGLTNVVIPKSVQTIGPYAFWGCTELAKASIGGGNIGDHAFLGCSNLVMVSFGTDVTAIGWEAFADCTKLEGVDIFFGVTNIEKGAFSNCASLTHATLGDDLLSIGAGAFRGCSNLADIAIPGSVTNIGMQAFTGSGLKTLYVPASWKGTTMLDGTGVPSGCKVVYGSGEEEAATATTPVAVPHTWLEAMAPNILAAAGGDYEAAAMAVAANGVDKVWQCYVAGLEPEDPESVFSMTAKMVDGAVQLGWEPDLGAERTYEVKGSESLASWGETNADSRFFRVNVGMPE